MAFYRERIYPHIVDALGNPKPIDDVRRRIILLAQGDVLEIGVGPGVNVRHYDADKVGRIYALEPKPLATMSAVAGSKIPIMKTNMRGRSDQRRT